MAHLYDLTYLCVGNFSPNIFSVGLKGYVATKQASRKLRPLRLSVLDNPHVFLTNIWTNYAKIFCIILTIWTFIYTVLKFKIALSGRD